MTVTADRYRTVGEVADEFRLSRRTIYRAVERGDLPAVRFGVQDWLRIPTSALDNLRGTHELRGERR